MSLYSFLWTLWWYHHCTFWPWNYLSCFPQKPSCIKHKNRHWGQLLSQEWFLSYLWLLHCQAVAYVISVSKSPQSLGVYEFMKTSWPFILKSSHMFLTNELHIVNIHSMSTTFPVTMYTNISGSSLLWIRSMQNSNSLLKSFMSWVSGFILAFIFHYATLSMPVSHRGFSYHTRLCVDPPWNAIGLFLA